MRCRWHRATRKQDTSLSGDIAHECGGSRDCHRSARRVARDTTRRAEREQVRGGRAGPWMDVTGSRADAQEVKVSSSSFISIGFNRASKYSLSTPILITSRIAPTPPPICSSFSAGAADSTSLAFNAIPISRNPAPGPHCSESWRHLWTCYLTHPPMRRSHCRRALSFTQGVPCDMYVRV